MARRAWSDTGLSQALAGVEIALCLLLFAASAFYVRRRLQNAKAAGLLPDTAKPARGAA